MEKIIKAIENAMREVGQDNIDYSEIPEDRHARGLTTYVNSENHEIEISFDAIDWHGFRAENVKIYITELPNLQEKLNDYDFN